MRRLIALVAIGVASCGPPTGDDQISMTQLYCGEKAMQLFPAVKGLVEAMGNETEDTPEPKPEPKLDTGQFRMLSTGKFVWDWTLPSPAKGKLICTGDFNMRRIETLNYNGLEKRPAANEVWQIFDYQSLPSEAEVVTVQNMEEFK